MKTLRLCAFVAILAATGSTITQSNFDGPCPGCPPPLCPPGTVCQI
jgi:hypothetical protein